MPGKSVSAEDVSEWRGLLDWAPPPLVAATGCRDFRLTVSVQGRHCRIYSKSLKSCILEDACAADGTSRSASVESASRRSCIPCILLGPLEFPGVAGLPHTSSLCTGYR